MRNLYKASISLILILATIPVMGQDNLDKWVDKCEKTESVNVTVVKRRNPDTGKLTENMKIISFKDIQSLHNDLISAIEKDKDKAYEIVEARKNGKSIPQIYSFRNGNIDRRFLFTIKDTKVELTIIEKELATKKK